jgi:hypothetical protein
MLRLFAKFVFDANKRLYEAPLLLVIEACKEMRLRLIHSGPTVRNRRSRHRFGLPNVCEGANSPMSWKPRTRDWALSLDLKRHSHAQAKPFRREIDLDVRPDLLRKHAFEKH